MPKLALASASPRRRELLRLLLTDFIVVPADIDETQQALEQAADYVLRLAKAKAEAGWQLQTPPVPTLGSDTIVVVDGQVLGKPDDQADFLRMMRLLSNRSHQVMTAVALKTATELRAFTVVTEVWFCAMTEQQMLDYWHSGEPQDKAGGYGIQGLAGRYVTHIQGSYFAVVGLPLFETAELLADLTV